MVKPNKTKLVITGLIVSYFLIAIFSHFLILYIDEKKPAQKKPRLFKEDLKIEDVPSVHVILRVERRIPEEDCTESVILVNKKEVARFRTKKGKVTQSSGKIPDGKLKNN